MDLPRRHVRFTLAYDGTEYSGWQWQPDRRTVQGELERALARVTGETTRVCGSGRTDAGVHALGQVASCCTRSRLDATTLSRALNANLPPDVVVLDVADAPVGFNAIEHAVSKLYRYVIHDGPLPDVFHRNHCWQLRGELDVAAMSDAASGLVGRHDFKAYESAGSRRAGTVRTILSFTVRRRPYQEGERILIEVEANGFLYNMVRNLTGTLVDVGRGKHPPSWPRELLATRDRRLAGMTAPAMGLYLVRVRLKMPDPSAVIA